MILRVAMVGVLALTLWVMAVPAQGQFARYKRASQPYGVAAAESRFEEAQREDVPRLSPELQSLRDRLREVLRDNQRRVLNTRDHTAWEVMHAVVAYGVHTRVKVGGPDGELQPAIGWLCFNRPFRRARLLTLVGGRPYGVLGVGLQGHHGQLLAILAQSQLLPDYPMRVKGREFTIEDLIEAEKLGCRPKTELTFKLIGLSHYLPSDATWKSSDGRDWSIERLIREEIKQPIQGTTCGGTHRLMGLSYAVAQRRVEGKPITGQFLRAEHYVEDYHDYALKLRNPDGSFSTKWLEYRQARPDVDRRLQTTGHILEWLVFSLPYERLLDPEIVESVDYLISILEKGRNREWEIGPLGHALHALVIYDRRVFAGEAPVPVPDVARAPVSEKATAEAPGAKPGLQAGEKPHKEPRKALPEVLDEPPVAAPPVPGEESPTSYEGSRLYLRPGQLP